MSDQEITPWNPDLKAVERVKNPLPAPQFCPICEDHVDVRHHQEIYGAEFGDWPWMYACDSCDARVGMHPGTNIPLGTLADEETREARKRCKEPFESLYKTGKMSRSQAYQALADKLGIPKEECHFGWFDVAMCERAAKAAREVFLESMMRRSA